MCSNLLNLGHPKFSFHPKNFWLFHFLVTIAVSHVNLQKYWMMEKMYLNQVMILAQNQYTNQYHDQMIYCWWTSNDLLLDLLMGGYSTAIEIVSYICQRKYISYTKWDKVFKNGPIKICGRQPLKILKWHGLP